MSPSGYFDSPWPAEDGGPARLQAPRRGAGLDLRPGERLQATSRRTTLSTMTVLGAPGEVFLLTHSALRAQLGLPTTACVERIDPVTLRTVCSSPRLPGGPMWPGGMAVHRNGDLYVVYGRYAHRLDRGCAVRASLQLPVKEAYNSFVVLDNGLIVTKNLSATTPARLTTIDPESLQPTCADAQAPEPSIARLSAIGNDVYVVGVRSIHRYRWDDAAQSLRLDPGWRCDYVGATHQSYGWDPVLDGQDAWFMDNGLHRYRIRMVGAGVHPTPNRLVRVSMQDASDTEAWTVCGLPGGSITNPPLVDPGRKIVVAYDSANSVVQAWRIEPGSRALTPAWRKAPFGCSSHMVLYPDTGELVLNDYRGMGEQIVVLDVATGEERGRVAKGGLMQSVVFPSAGWSRDVYWCSMDRLTRVSVA